MQVNDFILDDFCWSFSRVTSYDSCPLCFYYQYIKKYDDIDGCFGQYGTIIHDCLEKYALGDLMEYELLSYYEENYPKIVTDSFPPNKYTDVGNDYYNQGVEYFKNFNGFGDREIFAVEHRHYFKVGDYNFMGFIDLECDNEIVDHKTKGKQHITRLTKRHDKSEYIEMIDGRYIKFQEFIQLYLYVIPYFERYGIYPEILSLNMVRINDWYSVKFELERFKEAKRWAIDKITNIYNDKEFAKGKGDLQFFCDFICNQRLNCGYSSAFIGNMEEDLGVFDI